MNVDLVLNDEFWIYNGILIGVTVVSYLLLLAIFKVLANRLRQLRGQIHNRLVGIAAEMLVGTSRILLLTLSLLIAVRAAGLPEHLAPAMADAWFIALALQVALWLDIAARLWMESLTRDGKKRNPVTTTIVGILMRILIWVMMLLSILANLGVDITAMVASLGVGGVAVALAVQTLLSDVFASLSVGIDKPFEIGDFVVFGSVAGTVEQIGMRATHIRSLSGEQVVCSNAELLKQTLHNYKRMTTRRIVFKFGITYDTPADKVRQVSVLMRWIIDGVENAQFDRAHFFAFDESQLTFEVVYIMRVPDYNEYMDAQEEINFKLLEGIREMGVQFAFPTRSVILSGGTLPKLGIASLPADNCLPDKENVT